jgi:hypothetical protein
MERAKCDRGSPSLRINTCQLVGKFSVTSHAEEKSCDRRLRGDAAGKTLEQNLRHRDVELQPIAANLCDDAVEGSIGRFARPFNPKLAATASMRNWKARRINVVRAVVSMS